MIYNLWIFSWKIRFYLLILFVEESLDVRNRWKVSVVVERNDTSSVEPLLIRVLGEWDCPDFASQNKEFHLPHRKLTWRLLKNHHVLIGNTSSIISWMKLPAYNEFLPLNGFVSSALCAGSFSSSTWLEAIKEGWNLSFFLHWKKIKGSCRFCYASEDHLGGVFQLKPPTSHVHMFNRSQGANLNGTSLCSRRSKCFFQQLDTDFWWLSNCLCQAVKKKAKSIKLCKRQSWRKKHRWFIAIVCHLWKLGVVPWGVPWGFPQIISNNKQIQMNLIQIACLD